MEIPKKHIVLFDGVCHLCHSTVQFVMSKDKEGVFYFASLQSDIGQVILKAHHLDQNDFDTFIYFNGEENEVFEKSTAALNVFSKLPYPYRFFAIFKIVPRFIRDFVYMFVSKNRYKWFGKKDQCSLEFLDQTHRFLS
ncbi:MAG: thiol-disulfide oxidoreductase DCC family protein [Flavobacteriales bacterium]